jgi:deoxyribose-phosphate aldolase
VYPAFVGPARATLEAEGLLGRVAVATVVNFPSGSEQHDRVLSDIREAIGAGSDEIDLVFPWRALRDGDEESGRRLLAAARQACGDRVLKIILETGELGEPALIRRAAELAIESGADFLKTSTGKVPVNATPAAARILLETIRDSGREVGCKISGGIRTTAQARDYLDLAAGIMGSDWIAPEHFRFGASGLLDDLLATLGGDPSTGGEAGSY